MASSVPVHEPTHAFCCGWPAGVEGHYAVDMPLAVGTAKELPGSAMGDRAGENRECVSCRLSGCLVLFSAVAMCVDVYNSGKSNLVSFPCGRSRSLLVSDPLPSLLLYPSSSLWLSRVFAVDSAEEDARFLSLSSEQLRDSLRRNMTGTRTHTHTRTHAHTRTHTHTHKHARAHTRTKAHALD